MGLALLQLCKLWDVLCRAAGCRAAGCRARRAGHSAWRDSSPGHVLRVFSSGAVLAPWPRRVLCEV